jgi:hypothetical protein
MSRTPKSGHSDDGKKGTPKKRILNLRLTAAVKSDNAEAIRAIREALRKTHLLRVYEVPDEPAAPAATPEPPPAKDVKLSFDVTEDVRVHLEVRNAQAPPPAADAAKAQAIKRGLWKWLKDTAAAGWRVTVLAGLEWVTGKKVG